MDARALAAEAAALAARRGARAVLGLAGPPGAGKSTLARALVDALRSRAIYVPAAYVPLDGFHLSNAQLDRLGLRSRKGAEQTFDVWGYVALLHRLLDPAQAGHDIYVPDFDRTLDEPVAARHRVRPEARLIVTEGNYLACDLPGWREARACMAEVWYVDAPPALRDARLFARHTAHGDRPAAARARVDGNDRPNAAMVERSRARCDRVLSGPGAGGGSTAAPGRPTGPGGPGTEGGRGGA
ncbi:nucleoside/nucleotide kinase family protein [Streptomyces sp. DSM 44917]|uniref:Nucleoside/nucleotide kinase family protein n=1 Tax=Streptomyces boetiae TaxID=3075541 RepID=A0ABU2LB82_9ACTN|nr:nucleoside/nucleotide kinase family protein [Streptomyces sp. DSM 44917]MDT0308841.1 nucleoside/nucleotide kinase family protein [Streptomyces sp. DSM 44917]